jgi:hypothetical protein
VIRLNVQTLAIGAALVCEILGLISILFSADVEKSLLSIFVALGAGLWVMRVRIPNSFLRILVVAVVLGSIFTAIFSDNAIAITISRGIVLVHVLLWLAKDFPVFRFWRLGIGFVEVVLAAILTPETHMFFFIFFFTVSAALALSFGFLENRLQLHRPRELLRPISLKFFTGVLGASVLIFLSSLIIFPILPRSNWGGGANRWVDSGYAERVSFQGGTLLWAQGASRPMAWIFRNEESNWNEIIPFGLLRGKTLDSFNGVEWQPGSKEVRKNIQIEQKSISFQIVREPIKTDILPVPYGAQSVKIGKSSVGSLQSGEWLASRWVDKRVSYEVTLGAPLEFFSVPRKLHLNTGMDTNKHSGFYSLVKQLSKNASSDNAKIQAVVKYLRGFEYSLDPVPGIDSQKEHPIELFLLKSKKGHCEFFATAGATLLRAMGVPTRLVVGFRVNPGNGNVLKVTSQDAHAWIEVYTPKTGWFPLDLSPALPKTAPSWYSDFTDTYDLVNAYWHQYILGYEFDFREVLRTHAFNGFILFSLFLAIRFAFSLKGRRKKVGREKVEQIYRKWEKKKNFTRFITSRSGMLLHDQYLEYRFSSKIPEDHQLKDLHHQFQEEYHRFSSTPDAGEQKI